MVREPETIAAIADEWLPETVANKDGNGDGTGAISDATAQSISKGIFTNKCLWAKVSFGRRLSIWRRYLFPRRKTGCVYEGVSSSMCVLCSRWTSRTQLTILI